MGDKTTDGSIKIGCIGPADSIGVIREVVEKYYPKVTLLTYEEEKLVDAWRRLERCQRETEGILFTGVGVQEAARGGGEVTRPYEHVPRGSHSLIRALWEVVHQEREVRRISVDVVTDEILADVLEEFGIRFDRVHNMPFAPERGEQAYEDRHLELYRAGRVDAVITGFGAVYESLRQKKLPVFRLYPNSFQVRDNLEKLLDRIRATNLRSAGIAIQIIKLRSIVQHSINQYDDLKKEGQFYLELLEYVRAVQGSLFHLGREYVIYSTRGVMESRVHMEHFGRLLAWGRKRNILIASGIGIGITAFEAEKSARKALDNAVGMTESGFFIVNGDRIRGPLGEREELAYPIRVSEERDLRMADEIGINATYLAKIRALMAKTGKSAFDADDLAACLGVSERSARRLLKKFLDAGHARLVAKETARQVGRPKNLVELTL